MPARGSPGVLAEATVSAVDHLRAKPGRKVHLGRIDASAHEPFPNDKSEAVDELQKLRSRLDALQEGLYAEHRRSILIVLQGMDTAGKDGTIRHVFEGVNPQGVRVAQFRVPTPEEHDHDFLWRVHRDAPPAGEITIFNRSHYEDVLVVRVHRLVPRATWEGRYDEINAFEHLLRESGTRVLKFFLHIDRDEQTRRLRERWEDPQKRWKLSPNDLQERKFWPQYGAAYEEMLSRTSTDHAPWYIVPANHKWYRNWAVSRVLVDTLEEMDPHPPPSTLGTRRPPGL